MGKVLQHMESGAFDSPCVRRVQYPCFTRPSETESFHLPPTVCGAPPGGAKRAAPCPRSSLRGGPTNDTVWFAAIFVVRDVEVSSSNQGLSGRGSPSFSPSPLILVSAWQPVHPFVAKHPFFPAPFFGVTCPARGKAYPLTPLGFSCG